jgi:hypothetical protein
VDAARVSCCPGVSMPRAKTTARGYGSAHQAEREQWRPTVEAGLAQCAEPVCLMPSRWIPPGAAWDLAHDRQATRHAGVTVYRGPAHARCNRAEGARHRAHPTPTPLRRWVL